MRKLIIIVLFSLLYPSFALAEETEVFHDAYLYKKVEGSRTPREIANDIFLNEILDKYGYSLGLYSLLRAVGYRDLAREVLNDLEKKSDFYFLPNSDTFLKHSKKYKYDASDEDMALQIFMVLEGFKAGYTLGLTDGYISLLTKENRDMYKKNALNLYDKYLEEKSTK
jgi:hypothetical protein